MTAPHKRISNYFNLQPKQSFRDALLIFMLTATLIGVALQIRTNNRVDTSQRGTRQQLVAFEQRQCFQTVAGRVDALNRDYAIYTADAKAAADFRHVEANAIKFWDSKLAPVIDVSAIKKGNTPYLMWPAMRDIVYKAQFHCTTAFPSS